MRTGFKAVMLAAALLAGCTDQVVDTPAIRRVENARQSGLPTVVEFGSETCASCRTMHGVMENVTNLTQGRAHVLVMDILKQEGLIGQYRIQAMPTQVFFDASGREVKRNMGLMSEAQVLAALGLGTP